MKGKTIHFGITCLVIYSISASGITQPITVSDLGRQGKNLLSELKVIPCGGPLNVGPVANGDVGKKGEEVITSRFLKKSLRY